MILKCESVYKKGSNPVNEDALVINEDKNIFAVIDGATGLGGLPGKIAAEIVQNSLEKMSVDETLKDVIKRANLKLNAETTKTLGKIESIPKEKRSTCGLAAIKINKTCIEYVHAGDCMFFVEYKDKSVRTVTYDHVLKLDLQVKNQLKKIMHSKLLSENPNSWEDKKIDGFLREIKQEILPMLIECRKKLNSMDGYPIIDGSNESLFYLEHGFISLQNVARILLLTDGLQFPSEDISHQIWQITAEFAFKNGLKNLEKNVSELEKNDPACFTFPRLKTSDDKTGILISIEVTKRAF